ncbi:MAG: hypothetical protein EP332_10450 [Bacteroidetes bacterium]|nr:MAG: hypothetical protein EP332_10450 [Bacteroidota bacterium]
MNLKKLLRSNFGLIFLSISIIVAAALFRPSVTQQVSDSSYEKKIRLEGSLSSNTTEANFNTKFTVGDGQKLLVIQKDGTKELITGKDIMAQYYHVGQLLQVEYQSDSGKMVSYYAAPIKWVNVY